MISLGRSGQTLMIAVLLGSLLLLSIPILIHYTQIGTLHQAASEQRTKARTVAEEGLAYGARQLSASLAQWQSALNGNFQTAQGAPADTDCNTGDLILSPSGGAFRLTCSRDAVANQGLQPYQVAITAVALTKSKEALNASGWAPMRAMKGYYSQRTLGADLGDGLRAAAALQLVSTPTFRTPTIVPSTAAVGPLTVHWGPVVVLSTHTFKLSNPMDQADDRLDGTSGVVFPGFPRVFALGGITGTEYERSPNTTETAATTDRKQYYAFASLSLPPFIDEDYYRNQAQTVTSAISPPGGVGAPMFCTSLPANTCGYYETGASTAVFNSADPTGYSAPTGSVIFINGNAKFDRFGVNNSTIIVTGNLILDNPTGGFSGYEFQIPQTLSSEYAYWPKFPITTRKYPCFGRPGTNCNALDHDDVYPSPSDTPRIHFLGFLYVKGNLIVNQPGWRIVGSVLVGDMQSTPPTGQLQIQPNASLTVYYDANVNHQIHVHPIAGTAVKVVLDLAQDITLP